MNEEAKTYLKRYDMQPPQLGTYSGAAKVDDSTVNRSLIEAIKEERDRHRQKHNFRWVTKDKAKSSELVTRLQTLVTSISDHTSLNALQASNTRAGLLISLSAHLKHLQISSNYVSAAKVWETILTISNTPEKVIPIPEYLGNGKLCYVSAEGALDHRAWVEWKLISSALPLSKQDELLHRLKTLGKILTGTKLIQFCVPLCLGITWDPWGLKQIGLATGLSSRFGG